MRRHRGYTEKPVDVDDLSAGSIGVWDRERAGRLAYSKLVEFVWQGPPEIARDNGGSGDETKRGYRELRERNIPGDEES